MSRYVCYLDCFDKNMQQIWVKNCVNLFNNPKIKTLSSYKKHLTQPIQGYLKIHPDAIKQVHAFISSLPEKYRTIAISYAIENVFKYIFQTKVVLSQHPIWIRRNTFSTIHQQGLVTYHKYNTLNEAKTTFKSIRKNIKHSKTKIPNMIVLTQTSKNFVLPCEFTGVTQQQRVNPNPNNQNIYAYFFYE